MVRRRSLLAPLVTAVVLLAGSASASAVTLDEHSAGITPGSEPTAIVRGADGAMWFTEAGTGYPSVGGGIGRIDAKGRIRELRGGLPAGASPRSIVRGRDGNVWFTDPGTQRVGRVTPGGRIATFRTGLPAAQYLRGLAAGADGNVWFLGDGGRTVGRITPSGQVRRWARRVPRSIARLGGPFAMAPGPDGRIWFVSGRWLGRISTASGRVDWRALPGGGGGGAIAPGAAHTMWVTMSGGRVVRLDRDARPVSDQRRERLGGAQALAAAPDGTLWLTQHDDEQLVGFRGRSATFHGPGFPVGGGHEGPDGLRPGGIAIGPDGQPWLTGTDRVVHVLRVPACRVPDVLGATPDAARAALERAGCAVAVRAAGASGTGPVRVLTQSVERRRAIPRGRTVTLGVGPETEPCRWPEGIVAGKPIDGGILGTGTVRTDVTRGETRTYVCVPADHLVAFVGTVGYDDGDDWEVDSSSLEQVLVASPFAVSRYHWVNSKGAEQGDLLWLIDLRTGERREVGNVRGAAMQDLRLDADAVSWTENGVPHRVPVA